MHLYALRHKSLQTTTRRRFSTKCRLFISSFRQRRQHGAWNCTFAAMRETCGRVRGSHRRSIVYSVRFALALVIFASRRNAHKKTHFTRTARKHKEYSCLRLALFVCYVLLALCIMVHTRNIHFATTMRKRFMLCGCSSGGGALLCSLVLTTRAPDAFTL